jgi:hypothetical protein
VLIFASVYSSIYTKSTTLYDLRCAFSFQFTFYFMTYITSCMKYPFYGLMRGKFRRMMGSGEAIKCYVTQLG